MDLLNFLLKHILIFTFSGGFSHHFYAAPGKNFDAAPAPAPTLLYSKAKFIKRTLTHDETISSSNDSV
jgi:hypothetical protein